MEKCQYKNCQEVAITGGFVLAKNPDGGKDIPTDVLVCDKHKKVASFFEYPKKTNA